MRKKAARTVKEAVAQLDNTKAVSQMRRKWQTMPMTKDNILEMCGEKPTITYNDNDNDNDNDNENENEEDDNTYIAPSGEVTIVNDSAVVPYTQQRIKLSEQVSAFGMRIQKMKVWLTHTHKPTVKSDGCIMAMAQASKYLQQSKGKSDADYLRLYRYAYAEVCYTYNIIRELQREGILSLQMHNSLFKDYKDITRWMNCVIKKVAKKVE